MLAACAGTAPEPGFRLVNNAPLPVVEVNASPSSDQRWGGNRLPAALAPGAVVELRFPRGVECLHDVRAVYAGGRAEQRMGVDICGNPELVLGAGGGVAGAGNPSFHLVNQGARRVMQVFASPASVPTWGPDHLGSATVPPGSIAPIRLPSGECAYDLRIVYEDGRADERRNVDLCRVVNLVLR